MITYPAAILCRVPGEVSSSRELARWMVLGAEPCTSKDAEMAATSKIPSNPGRCHKERMIKWLTEGEEAFPGVQGVLRGV